MENKNPTWVELVQATFDANQSLSALYMWVKLKGSIRSRPIKKPKHTWTPMSLLRQSPLDGAEEYNIWLANLTEVEVDILTGEYKVTLAWN